MPYSFPNNIPDYIKNIPAGAQHIFVKAFNIEYVRSHNDEKAIMAGWGAVKSKYKKNNSGKWIMKNQILFIMQSPFEGGIIEDESLLKRLFADKYDEAVQFEQQLKESYPNYFGSGKPFVTSGFFLKYQQTKSYDKLEFVATDGIKCWMSRKDFEQQVKDGEFNGLPMHRGHTDYPEDQNEFKEPFGSVLSTEIKNEGAYGYYYILPSEFKLRMDIASSKSIGFGRAPIRDLSAQFGAKEFNSKTNQIRKIKATSIDLVYKKLAAMPGSAFDSIIANQKSQEDEMDREEVLKTMTLEEMKTNENLKPLVAKLQEQAREGYVKKDEITKLVETDSKLRAEVIKCQIVVDDIKKSDKDLQDKKKTFEEKGVEFLKNQEIPEEEAKKIITDMGETMEFDVLKLQDWHKQMSGLGLTFKSTGKSEGGDEDLDKKKKNQSDETPIEHLVNTI